MTHSPAPEHPQRHRDGRITVILVVLCQLVHGITFSAIPLLLPLIREDLQISFSQAGMLSAAATASYALGQINFLRSHDCDEIQGYYFAQPLSVKESTRMLAEDTRLPLPQNPAPGDIITLLLVVEDNTELKLLNAAFGPDQFRVLTATNADDGFEILARNRVDVVISYNDMSGITGVQFLTRVRKLYANTLRVLASSGDTPTLTRATNMAGIHLFVPKNWSAERLNKEVRDTLKAYINTTAGSGPHPMLQSAAD